MDDLQMGLREIYITKILFIHLQREVSKGKKNLLKFKLVGVFTTLLGGSYSV
jgi:hypothetical protein